MIRTEFVIASAVLVVTFSAPAAKAQLSLEIRVTDLKTWIVNDSATPQGVIFWS